MKLSKNLRLLVRVRDYETAQIEVGAEISHFDLGYDDQSWAGVLDKRRQDLVEKLHNVLEEEVDRLARQELATVGEWSEFSPNLAEDYLQTPPAHLQRNQNARNQKTGSTVPTTGRRIRRGGASTPPSSPRPLRPA